MKVLLATNDIVLISRIEALLTEEDLSYFVADQHMSALEGSVGFLPRRIMVLDEDLAEAQALLIAEGLEKELKGG